MRINRRTLFAAAATASTLAWAPATANAAGASRRGVRLGVNYTPSTRWFHI
ncbi:hypothetical protein A8924_5650 [Saccharopolyspora erythraea NRRL 2338]|uniref:Uncharacterized protein n=2 Tax=Saccharopolyspora erythraea TaxID=1836 RepID=A4FKD2_SACEN|nr:hypothetical protein [Saccharopolyspora erythraea]EQD81482.1 hypothetical protein N599_35940 [Saccharopolyspora erythraea D]PFG98147.1 hypothetical protein A8924_5650 [Saccharopolyspora erythraea NRRL 2338]QRK88249.1 hypothetical protein JQX30_26660 [Saccharopolyspora erythraea]CAM04507.1 hypothetical protein SACE_5267 [Saccharopolyspora erythraea NRRL 2338]